MYMLTNYGGSGLQVVVPDPADAGGAAINANFKALATQVAAADPGVDDDATAGFGVGSRWYNYATSLEWICLDATPGAADWAAIAGSALAGYLPLAGGTLTATLTINTSANSGLVYAIGGAPKCDAAVYTPAGDNLSWALYNETSSVNSIRVDLTTDALFSKNNTLDDGSGNMTLGGSLVVNGESLSFGSPSNG